MHLAASVGNKAVVAFLLKRHADLAVKDRWGGTALSDAVREGNLECAELLRQAGTVTLPLHYRYITVTRVRRAAAPGGHRYITVTLQLHYRYITVT